MVLSGAVAGFGRKHSSDGVLNRFITNFSPGYGFTGLPWPSLVAENPGVCS